MLTHKQSPSCSDRRRSWDGRSDRDDRNKSANAVNADCRHSIDINSDGESTSHATSEDHFVRRAAERVSPESLPLYLSWILMLMRINCSLLQIHVTKKHLTHLRLEIWLLGGVVEYVDV
jgi:hypothetical protein